MEEYNARPREFPPTQRDYKENQTKLLLSKSRDVSCIIQHIPLDQDVFATEVETQFRKVTIESNQGSDLDSNLQSPKKKKNVILNHLINFE